MNKLTTKGLLAILLMAAILLAACSPKGPGPLGQVLKIPFSSQDQQSSSEQAIPMKAIKGLY